MQVGRYHGEDGRQRTMESIEMRKRGSRAGVALMALTVLAACEEPLDLPLPTTEEVESFYEYGGDLQAEVTGNVAVITVVQSSSQLRRGGILWAKVGPYIFLFTEETQTLLEAYPGLAGIRVETRVRNGPVVASVLMARDAMTVVQWRRALNIAGRARRDGSTSLTLLENLVRWGEDHANEFEYNPRYTARR